METVNWSQPQRQPLAGLAVVFINTVWEVLKRFWIIIILMFIGNNREGRMDRYEIIGLIVLAGTIVSAVLRFFYFRFHLEEDKLVIRKGWITKTTNIIPLEKIQTVHIEQGPVHQMLNIVKVSINTAGSRTTEGTIDAMYRSMAVELREKLLSQKESMAVSETPREEAPSPVVRLSGTDILKLSISANHIEAFFIILTFFFGLYENLKGIIDEELSETALERSATLPILFLVIAILTITILVSTARIVFSFWNFTLTPVSRGFHIRSGLTHVKERVVGFPKIQYISWKANWIRKLMNLWMLEFHVAGGDEMKEGEKVKIPLTAEHNLHILTQPYHAIPDTSSLQGLRMHPSFVVRRILILGIVPCFLLIPVSWFAGLAFYSIFWLLLPVIIGIAAALARRRFRLWLTNDVVVIRRGFLGEERVLLRCMKLQSAELRQTMFQRRKQLANIVLYTAGGNVHVNFIPLQSAQALTNYVLYCAESTSENWM
ncbi:MAG TPA: PH domain-containing protein [Flavisolibacter sp.]